MRSQFVTSSSHGGRRYAPVGVKNAISAKSAVEPADEAVDDVLGLLGEARPEEEKSRDPE